MNIGNIFNIFGKKKVDETLYGFKIQDDIKKKLIKYFNTKPYGDVDVMIKSLEDDDANTYFSEAGIKQIASYLKSQPRKEVKGLIELLTTPEVITKYSLAKKADDLQKAAEQLKSTIL